MSADAETLAVYAAEAKRYATRAPDPAEEDSLRRFLDRLPSAARVLDLGCGPGLQAAVMQARGFDVTGWDASAEFVAAARTRGIDAHLRTFDDLASEPGTFDAVWASFSLLHAPRADLPRHLRAIGSRLNPCGHLFLGMKLGQGERRDALGRFYSYVEEDELRGELARAGFTMLETETGTGRGLAGTDDAYILATARHG